MRGKQSSARQSHRRRLPALAGASLAALALGMSVPYGKAMAQSFQADGNVTSGVATITTGPGFTGVNVESTEVIIEWIPFDNAIVPTPIDVQPTGTIAEFRDGGPIQGGNYTVLNRFIPLDGSGSPIDRVVAFDGTVSSLIGNSTGGNIWFYSPTGIMLGPNAQFNIGSLLLATNDIVTTGGLFGPGGTIRFNGPIDGTGLVDITAGAQINAVSPDSAYVAVVSPRIQQGGSIQSDGATALVAAEAGNIAVTTTADVSFNLGLLDVTVTRGTSDANGVVHSGSTGGPQSTGSTDTQAIGIVAIPKNTALTMLLSGSIGYTPAATAAADGGTVFLIGGESAAFDTLPPSTVAGAIDIGNASFSSRLSAFSNASIDVSPPGGGTTLFQRNATLQAPTVSLIADAESQILSTDATQSLNVSAPGGGDITVRAGPGISALPAGVIDVAGSFSLTASDNAGNNNSDIGLGGSVQVTADGGSISAGIMAIRALGIGGSNIDAGGDGIGGTVDIIALDGGSISTPNLLAITTGQGGSADIGPAGQGLGGTLTVLADGGTINAPETLLLSEGLGGTGFDDGSTGGIGRGGSIDIDVANGGTFSSTTSTRFAANGTGGGGFEAAGDGFGGSVFVSDTGGTFDFGGVILEADATGGVGVVASGDATLGGIRIEITGQSQTWGGIAASASAFAGEAIVAGSTGGNAQADPDGGVSLIVTSGQTLNIGSVQLDSNAFAGTESGAAGLATGGFAGVSVATGGSLLVDQAIDLSAIGGINTANFTANPGTTPQVQGGEVEILADGGTIAAGQIDATAGAFGAGATTFAGTATGGTATLTVLNGGSVSTIDRGASVFQGDINIDADAFGATGPIPSNATGGTVRVRAEDGLISADGTALVSASATDDFLTGATLGDGYGASGGLVTIFSAPGSNGTASMNFGSLMVFADGNASGPNGGTTAIEGNGGLGKGGSIDLTIDAGTFTAGATTLHASGIGGNSAASSAGTAFDSGDGEGGEIQFSLNGGAAGFTTLDLISQGIGGSAAGPAFSGETPSSGGNGRESTDADPDIVFAVNGGTFSATSLLLDVSAFGGDGMDNTNGISGDPGGNGGNADSGTAQFTVADTATSFTTGGLTIASDATGGAGGSSLAGEHGIGGSALADAVSISLTGPASLGSVVLSANAAGGAGASGGDATGGIASFTVPDDLSGNTDPRQLSGLALSANGVGGTASTGTDGTSIAGSAALAVTATNAAKALTIDGDLSVQALGTDGLAGNGFTSTVTGQPLTVTGTTTIETDRDVSLTVNAGSSFDTQGALSVTTPRNVTATGAITSGGNASITGDLGIALSNLSSGGTTLLQAVSGPVTISTDLQSTGPVTVLGQSVDITSLGALTFADADATAGDLSVDAAGNLQFATVDATGAVTLSSSAGTLANSGTVNGATIALSAQGDIDSTGDLNSAGTLAVQSGNTFTATGLAQSGGDTTVSGTSGIDMAALQSGGTTSLQSASGPVTIDALTSAGLVTVSGQSADLTSPGSLSFADADATGGDLSIVTNGSLAMTTADATGAVVLQSQTDTLTITGAVNGGSIALTAPGAITASGNLTSGNTLNVQTSAAFNYTATAIAGGNTSIIAPLGITMDTLQSGGATLLQATGGTVSLNDLTSSGLVTVLGEAVTIGSSGGLNFADADATNGDLAISVANDLALATADATGAVALSSSSGALSVSNGITGGTITLIAPVSVDAGGTVVSGDTLQVQSGGTFLATGSMAAGGNTSIAAASDMTIGGLQSGGTTLLQAANGIVAVDDLGSAGLVTAQGTAVDIDSSGSLDFTDASASDGSVVIGADGDLSFAAASATQSIGLVSRGGSISTSDDINGVDLTLSAATGIQADGQLTGTVSLSLLAGDAITVNAAAVAPTIVAQSADLDIGTSGQIGQRGITSSVSLLNSTPANRTLVGGTDQTGEYSLDADEAARLFADDSIDISTQPGTSAEAIAVGALDLTFGAGTTDNIGSGGVLRLITDELITVGGAVTLSTSGIDDNFDLIGSRVHVLTDTGGAITMAGANGNPQGLLTVEADTFAVAASAVIDQIDMASDTATITGLLDQPDISTSAPFITADTIQPTISSGLFIQNSGPDTEFATRDGFAARDLSITTLAADTVISINGVTFDAQSQPVRGLDTAATVTINGSAATATGQFDPLSTINGCVIGATCSRTTTPELPPGLILREPEIETTVETTDPTIDLLPGIELQEAEPDALLPLVDEPVTGVGNDDLWEQRCRSDSDRCDQQEGEP